MDEVKKSLNMNVCFVVNSLMPGGTETYLLRFIKYIGSELDVLIICKGGVTGELEEAYIKEGVKIEVLKGGYLNFKSLKAFSNLLRKFEIETVCDFTGNFAGFFMLIANLTGVKTRIAFYRRSSNAFESHFFNALFNWGVNNLVKMNSTNIVSNSKAGLDFFFKGVEFDNRFDIIYNGINTENFVTEDLSISVRKELKIPDEAFVIGHTGRVNKAKNHQMILNVAEQICMNNKKVVFLFCGTGTESLKKLVSPGISNQIIALGYRSDIGKVLKAVDIFFFPSITEGQPNALIEAMISDLPFLASNIPSILEIVPKKLHCNLLNPRDLSGYVSLINHYLVNSEDLAMQKCTSYAKNAFNDVQNFRKFLKILNPKLD